MPISIENKITLNKNKDSGRVDATQARVEGQRLNESFINEAASTEPTALERLSGAPVVEKANDSLSDLGEIIVVSLRSENTTYADVKRTHAYTGQCPSCGNTHCTRCKC